MSPSLPSLFLQFMRLIKVRMNTSSKGKLLSPHEGMALKYFNEEPHATVSSFAHFFRVQKPTATAMIQNLIRKGLLERIQDEEDRRVFQIVPTPKGQQQHKRFKLVFESEMGALFTALNPSDQKTLYRLLSQLISDAHA